MGMRRIYSNPNLHGEGKEKVEGKKEKSEEEGGEKQRGMKFGVKRNERKSRGEGRESVAKGGERIAAIM
jgi:hypothetical protein